MMKTFVDIFEKITAITLNGGARIEVGEKTGIKNIIHAFSTDGEKRTEAYVVICGDVVGMQIFHEMVEKVESDNLLQTMVEKATSSLKSGELVM